MRRRQLDLYRPMTLLKAVDENEEFQEVIDKERVGQLNRKKLNIPAPDNYVDADYEKNNKADFALPESYIRSARKLPGEADVSIDYLIEPDDKEWLQSYLKKHSSDKDLQKSFNEDSFETIIDILEANTGHQKSIVGKDIAEQEIQSQLKWSVSTSTKVVSDVYNYWSKKRDKVHKPLNRRYWPMTSSTDSNPAHVFRPRDKERYRLRKAHRKNDLEGFRRMQQLRKEFIKAQELLQLVVEREKLKLAALDVRHEIFEQALYDLNPSMAPASSVAKENGADTSVSTNAAGGDLLVPIPRRKTPWRYKLEYEHLLHSDEVNSRDDNYTHSAPFLFNRQRPVMSLADQRQKMQIEQNAFPSGSQHTAAINRRKRDHKPLSGPNNVPDSYYDPVPTQPPPPERVIQPVTDIMALRKGLVIDGPDIDCRPAWPSFLNPLKARDKSHMPLNQTEYLEDLEFQLDVNGAPMIPVKYRCRGRIGRGGRLVMDRIPTYLANCNATGTRESVGIQSTSASSFPFAKQTPLVTYIYPTSLHDYHMPYHMPKDFIHKENRNSSSVSDSTYLVDNGLNNNEEMSGNKQLSSNNAGGTNDAVPSTSVENNGDGTTNANINANTSGVTSDILSSAATNIEGTTSSSSSGGKGQGILSQRPMFTDMLAKKLPVYTTPAYPPSFPLRRSSLPPQLSTREKDIYAWSDSDEESVDFLSERCGQPLIDSSIQNNADEKILMKFSVES